MCHWPPGSGAASGSCRCGGIRSLGIGLPADLSVGRGLEGFGGAASAAGAGPRERDRCLRRLRAAARWRPAGHGLVMAGDSYRALIADLAPDRLLDRDQELAELAGFCAGEQTYAWWQGLPWAGKTALLSWFALHPPEGVAVVSFFVMSRLAGQSDSGAFTSAMAEQLGPLAGGSADLGSGHGHGHVLRFLESAASLLGRADTGLLVVVDGIDEDTGTETGLVSIASLLPQRPPPGVRVLVASRTSPALPDDVRGDHPLRRIQARRLAASPHAVGVREAARHELARALSRPGIQRDILGLLAASGGGLSGHDLEDLTGSPPYELSRQLDGVLGRTVAGLSQPDPGAARPAERVYVFAHEALREEAELQYGATLTRYGDRLRRWADSYRARGWPDGTPMYLVRGYPKLLVSAGDGAALVAFATDGLRHQRMFQVTGGDAQALADIAAAARLLARHDEPDLAALALLALTRDQLAHHYRRMPAALPVAWAAVGEPVRGIALALCLPDPMDRAHALGMIARAQVAAGHECAVQAAEAAEAAGRSAGDRNFHLRALAAAAETWALVGNRERAAAAASEAEDGVAALCVAPLVPVLVLCQTARAWAGLGDREQAVISAGAAMNSAAALTLPGAFSEVAGAWAAIGERARAVLAASAAEAITSHREIEPYDAARAWAAAGDFDLAEQLARGLAYAPARDSVYADLVLRLSASGEYQEAEQLAYGISSPEGRVMALSVIAGARAAAGDREGAASAAAAAEAETGMISNTAKLVEALCSVASARAAAGDSEGAVHAVTAAQARTWPGSDPDDDQAVLNKTAQALAAAGDPGGAEQLAHVIADPRSQLDVLVLAAQAWIVAGMRVEAVRLLDAAEVVARQISDPGRESSAACHSPYPQWADSRSPMQVVAEAWASVGERGRAEQIAGVSMPGPSASVQVARAYKLADGGQFDAAGQAARAITDVPVRAAILALVAQRSAAAGEPGRAAPLAQEIADLAGTATDPASRARLLVESCVAWAAAGNNEHCAQSAHDAETAFTELAATQLPDAETARYALVQRSCLMARAWSLARDRARAVQAAAAAERAAGKYADDGARAQALGHAALAWLSAGDHYRAAQTFAAAQAAAAKLTEPGIRMIPQLRLAGLGANPELAEALARASHPAVMSAQRLLAEMISTSDWESSESGSGTWMMTLPLTGQVDLPALQRFGSTLLARAHAHVKPCTGKSDPHAFISYVREDSAKIDWLERILQSAGIQVWRDTADLWPGEDWRAKIRHAITDNALVFIACFSRHSTSRKATYMNEELLLAVEQSRLRQPGEPWLIPVRFDDCNIPDIDIGGGRTLSSIQHADLFGKHPDQDAERLVTSVLRILARNSEPSCQQNR